MEALREQRESTICTTREELYSAQEEVPFLPVVLSPRVPHDILTHFNCQFKKIVPLTWRIWFGMLDSCFAACHGGCHCGARAGYRRPAGWPGLRQIRVGALEERSCEVRGGDRSSAAGFHAAAAAPEHCHPAAGWARSSIISSGFRMSPPAMAHTWPWPNTSLLQWSVASCSSGVPVYSRNVTAWEVKERLFQTNCSACRLNSAGRHWNMWHLALDSTKTMLGRPVRTFHHDVISVCISAWLQHQRAQSSPQQQFGVPGEKGGSPAGQAGFSRKSTRAGRQQVEDPAGPGSGPHTHITEGGTHF